VERSDLTVVRLTDPSNERVSVDGLIYVITGAPARRS
jgi:hypothetical protein